MLNAMAAGLPIVACESAAHPLTHDRDGLIVEGDDAEVFADAILRLMRDQELRRRLGEGARATAEADHGPSHCARRLESVMLDACAKE